ncbi:MAG: PAS domain-containing protein [Solirubrobacteraceae bacterium MAG38_C4-C5]|nr:PAS domain-containing protein [Candidatus Siliceabacter maunaloa]
MTDDGPPQQPLELILARNLISIVQVAAFLTDAQGDVLFYDEAAGAILGRSPALHENRPVHGRFRIRSRARRPQRAVAGRRGQRVWCCRGRRLDQASRSACAPELVGTIT